MIKYFLLTSTVVAILLGSLSTSSAQNGSALQFTGFQYATRATPISVLQNNITMQCWVKWDGTNGGNVMRIYYNGNSNNSGYGIVTQAGTQNIGLLVGFFAITYSTTPLIANTWQHLALVRNAGAWSLYVNGIVTTLASGATPNVPTAPNGILGSSIFNESFQGVIDEVSFFSTPISGANILAYKDVPISAGHPNFANLVAYYQLNEGSGQIAGSGGAGLDLTLGSTAGVDANDPTWTTTVAPLVPTLGEWGMIIFGLSIIGIGVWFVNKRGKFGVAV